MAWKYSEKVKDHYLHPRNVGEINNPDAIGEVGSMVCGDALKLYLRIDKDKDIIEDARFQTYGCGSAIASSSALTELIKGKSIDEALKISNKDLADYLDGLPEEKMHCSVMGKEALEAAIANFRGVNINTLHEDEGKLVCHCFGITDQQIIKVIKENNLKTVGEVTNYTKAGGACGSCLGEIQDILAETTAQKPLPVVIEVIQKKQSPSDTIELPQIIEKPANVPAGLFSKLSPYKKMKAIEEVLEKEISIALNLDQGGIELIDVDENTIYIRLLGRCHACAFSGDTMGFISDTLSDALGEKVSVIKVD